jgi:hypothetical protein
LAFLAPRLQRGSRAGVVFILGTCSSAVPAPESFSFQEILHQRISALGPFSKRRGMEMPQSDNVQNFPLLAHVEAVILSVHHLELKLRATIKSPTEADAHLVSVLRLLSRDLIKSSARLDRDIVRLEKRRKTMLKDRLQ